MKQLERLAPVGRDFAADLKRYFITLGIAAVFSLGYCLRLADALYQLGKTPWVGMPSYVDLLGWSLCLFPVVSIASLGYIAVYYQMHYGASRSVYLMRRLPDRWSFHRRCLSLPLFAVFGSLACAGALLLIYYGLYCAFTPNTALQTGQLALLVRTWTMWI